MTGVIRELGARSNQLLASLGRLANFGGALIAAMPQPPTRFGFFLRALSLFLPVLLWP